MIVFNFKKLENGGNEKEFEIELPVDFAS